MNFHSADKSSVAFMRALSVLGLLGLAMGLAYPSTLNGGLLAMSSADAEQVVGWGNCESDQASAKTWCHLGVDLAPCVGSYGCDSLCATDCSPGFAGAQPGGGLPQLGYFSNSSCAPLFTYFTRECTWFCYCAGTVTSGPHPCASRNYTSWSACD